MRLPSMPNHKLCNRCVTSKASFGSLAFLWCAFSRPGIFTVMYRIPERQTPIAFSAWTR